MAIILKKTLASDISLMRAAYEGRFEEVSAAILVAVPPTGEIVAVNAEAEELTGYERDELTRMSLADIFCEEDKPRIHSMFSGPLDKFFRKLFEHNVIIQKRSKRKIIVDMGFRLAQIGDWEALVFTLQDITDLKNSEQRIARSNAYVSNILNSASETMLVVDERGIINTANEAAQILLEYTEAELVGANVDTIIAEIDGRLFSAQGLNWTGNTPEVEAMLRSKNDKLIPVLLSAASMRGNALERDRRMVVVAMDLSERKKAENLIQAQHMMIIQSAKMSELGEMASGIAHEINNPLLVIKGQCEMLELTLQDPQLQISRVRDAVTHIDAMATRIEKIVNGLRTFSRDQRFDAPEAVALANVVRDTLTLCEQRLRNHGITLTLPDMDESLALECRPTQISQVLLNLLNNAFDAIENDKEKWIKMEIEHGGHYLIIAVSNSGEPIRPDLGEKIFQPFFTTKTAGRGTGLGLSISRSIAEAHGGQLVLDAEAKHPRFILRLPWRQSLQRKAG